MSSEARARSILELIRRLFRNRSFLPGIERIASKLEDGVPFCEIFRVPNGYALPPDFTISRYLGLFSCQIAKDDCTATVVVYWRDHTHANCYRKRLMSDIAVPPPALAGFIVDVKRRVDPFWKRHSLAAEIIGIAALFGALSTIRDYYSVLFTKPVFDTYFTNASPIDVIEGSPLTAVLDTQSEVRFAPMKINFQSAVLHPRSRGQDVTINFDKTIFASLAPGASESVHLYGIAPRHGPSQNGPDLYYVAVQGTANAGVVRFGVPIVPSPMEVRVWSAKTQHSSLRVLNTNGKVCTLGETIYPSRLYRNGEEVQVLYASPPSEVLNAYLYAPGATISDTSFQDKGSGPERVLTITFTTPELNQFEHYQFKVLLYFSTRVSENACQNSGGKMEVELQ